MLETAIRRRYPVDAARAAETVNAFLDSPDARVALRAAQIAALMEGQNQKDEHKGLDEFSARVIELANRCGINPTALGVGQDADEPAAGSDVPSTATEQE